MRGLSLHRVGWRRALRPPPRRCNSTFERLIHTSKEVNLTDLTPKWQSLWKDLGRKGGQSRRSDREQVYILPMFPYPSGTLHLGHLRVYTISDVLARFKHMQGYDVLHPIGWDAFGLPAENAAIERGVHPATWTLQNITAMKEQMMEMGGRWSWDTEFRTCDPDFYTHTQRLFLMLFERGLAYQAESIVNWDPVDQTVLANEQVDANGCSWRSGAKVEKKMLKQWFLKIKEFQEPLLEDLEALADNGRWPERVLAMQKNWIGRSVGTKLWFDVENTNTQAAASSFEPVDVFTTRADTLLGVMYVALSLKHPIVKQLAKEDEALRDFIKRAERFPPDSKEGWLLQGVQAINPVADLINDKHVAKQIPVFVAPYVLDDYGSGAVMGVPAHDARDHAFWRQNQGSHPVRHVITSKPDSKEPFSKEATDGDDKPMLEKGFVVSSDSGFSGIPSDQAVDEIITRLEGAGKRVEQTENWRLRDWLISRQRYWGTPIPIVHCNSCGPVPEPVQKLPVKLPDLPASYFQGRTGNPLAQGEEWKKTICPKCNGVAERETDTMDTFMDSSWYFFRFLDAKNKQSPVDPEKADRGMPVDIYIGGVEHAILHLLYARFISKFLATTPLWPNGNKALGEPFKQLITQGMVHGKTYSDPSMGRFLRPEEVDLSKPSAPVIKDTDIPPKVSYEKMSKSKYNGVDPGTTIATYGADVTRAHMLFQAPVSDVLEWDEQKITGVQRWLARVLKLSRVFWYPAQDLKRFKPPKDMDIRVVPLLKLLNKQGIFKVPNEVERAKTNSTANPFLVSAKKKEPTSPGNLPDQAEILTSLVKNSDAQLLTHLHNTIASVTASYTSTPPSLNTIVSDLMALTNAIWDTPHVSGSTPVFKYIAVVHLLRMLAPIAPGVAEEGWHTLHSITNVQIQKDRTHPLAATFSTSDPSLFPFGWPGSSVGPSVFEFGWPIPDTENLPLLNPLVTCVVQIDGKRRFQANIKKLPADLLVDPSGNRIRGDDTGGIAQFVLDQLVQTEDGKKFLEKGSGVIWKAKSETGGDEGDDGKVHPVYGVVPANWKVFVAKEGQLVNIVGPRKEKTEARERKEVKIENEEEMEAEVQGMIQATREDAAKMGTKAKEETEVKEEAKPRELPRWKRKITEKKLRKKEKILEKADQETRWDE